MTNCTAIKDKASFCTVICWTVVHNVELHNKLNIFYLIKFSQAHYSYATDKIFDRRVRAENNATNKGLISKIYKQLI